MSMTTNDPFFQYVAGLTMEGSFARFPCPLSKTQIDVLIDGGFATIETTRTFRNVEMDAIEAILTFPVPIDAVMHDLVVEIDGRRLAGKAVARGVARESYEQAIDDGKTAILHEEVLRGVHTISVGQLGPGKTCAVTSSFSTVMALGERGALSLRIPTTVGEVYGRLPVNPADDLETGGRPQKATLRVTSRRGTAHVIGESVVVDGCAFQGVVDLGHAIDIAVVGDDVSGCEGVGADGRRISLRFAERQKVPGPLDLAIVFDRSGSTGGTIRDDHGGATVWSAMRDALRHAFGRLGESDRIALYEFDTQVACLGLGQGTRARDLLHHLSPPGGGTEIGLAIGEALADAHTDILVLTDGRSGALDVHGLAARGARISVLLVGPDSLEAMIGHLAMLTGGQIGCASGNDARDRLPPLMSALRVPALPASRAASDVPVGLFSAIRNGRTLTVAWDDAGTELARDAVDARIARGLGAYAAALLLPALTRDAATALAVAHNLTTHLTSLLIVDEAGEAQDGIPATRKVALPQPYAAAVRAPAPAMAMAPPPMAGAMRPSDSSFPAFSLRRAARPVEPVRSSERPKPATVGSDMSAAIASLASRIDWSRWDHKLARGDIGGLDDQLQRVLTEIASRKSVREAGIRASLDPLIVAAAVVALEMPNDRAAQRVVRAVVAKMGRAALEATAHGLRADNASPNTFVRLWGRVRGSDRHTGV